MAPADVFACRRCGRCCQGKGGIVLGVRDIERLCRYLDVSPEALLSRYAELVGEMPRFVSGADGYCIFYKDGCGVHPARPDVCRAWPYFRANLDDSLSFAMARQDCPGIDPAVTHEAFVRAGEAYLASQGLVLTGEDVPRALAMRTTQAGEGTHGRPDLDAA